MREPTQHDWDQCFSVPQIQKTGVLCHCCCFSFLGYRFTFSFLILAPPPEKAYIQRDCRLYDDELTTPLSGAYPDVF